MVRQLQKYLINLSNILRSILRAIANHSNAKATFIQSTRMQRFLKTFKPCHIGIHWIALTEYFMMSTYVPEFQSFYMFLLHFVLAKLATSSKRVNVLRSKALPLTASCLSPLPGFESCLEHVRKLPVTYG